jgi:hypothetical protein
LHITDGPGHQKDRLLAIQENLIGFLLDEVLNPARKHYYDGYKKLL